MDKKRIIILSTITFVFVIAGLLWIKIFETKTVYKEKIVYKEKEKKTLTDIKKYENIVFLGDSITELYPIDNIFSDLPIVKSGISGYTTQDILDRMESMVYQYNPTSIFLLIGTNDIIQEGEDKNKEAVDNIKKIVEEIEKHRNKSKIYIESIYPVNKSIDRSMVRNRDNKTIQEMNDKIEEYCNKNNITYINMYDELTDENGNFSSDYTFDGLHPSELGYAKISQVRLKYIYDIKES